MLLELHAGRFRAACNLANGQLVSFTHAGVEFFHGGGKPAELQSPEDALGWQNSEIVMFPVIGPVKENALQLGNVRYPMAQHGLSRHLPWTVSEQRADSVCFLQRYEAHTLVQNTKIPEPLRWPYSFTLEKRITLTSSGMEVILAVKNESDEDMPYMIGWHPAFRLLQDTIGGRRIEEVQASRAIELDINAVAFGPLLVRSDLRHMTLWSPKGSKLLCIEPMSRLQVWTGLEGFTDEDFLLAPGERREHRVFLLL